MLHVIGVPDAQRAALEEHVREARAPEVISLRGRLDDDEYRSLFASSLLALLPSSAEGLGIPVLEAMRLEIPVVASGLSSVREAGGEHAWYATPGDVDGFASAIRQALAAPASRIESARRHVSTFTWRRSAEVLRESLMLAANPSGATRGRTI